MLGCLKTRTRYDETTAWGHQENTNPPSRLDPQAPGMSFRGAERRRSGLGDPPQAAGKVAFLERLNLAQMPAAGEIDDELAGEEVDGEAAVLIDVVAVERAAPVVSVSRVPDGVDEDAAASQHPADLAGQAADLRGGHGHAQQHVREDRVECGIRERQRIAHVVHRCGNPSRESLVARSVPQLLQSGGADVDGIHGKAVPGEEQSVTPVPAPEFQHGPGPGSMEGRGGMNGRRGRMFPVHARVSLIRALPAPTLRRRELRILPAHPGAPGFLPSPGCARA